MNDWISCNDCLPPKIRPFLFTYDMGFGIGDWQQCYKIINGNSEKTHFAYVLVNVCDRDLNDNVHYHWDDDHMKAMDVLWRNFPLLDKGMIYRQPRLPPSCLKGPDDRPPGEINEKD